MGATTRRRVLTAGLAAGLGAGVWAGLAAPNGGTVGNATDGTVVIEHWRVKHGAARIFAARYENDVLPAMAAIAGYGGSRIRVRGGRVTVRHRVRDRETARDFPQAFETAWRRRAGTDPIDGLAAGLLENALACRVRITDL